VKDTSATTLLLSEIFPPRTGGSGRWFWEIYSRLPRDQMVIAAGEAPRQEEFDRTHDLRVVRLPLSMTQWGLRSVQGLRGYWRAARKLRRLVKAERVGVIHCGRCLPEGFLALCLRYYLGLPYVCYAHGEEMSCASLSRELSWMIRRVFGGAALVIANSRNTERILREEWNLPAERVRLLHPGVDTQRFVPAPRDLEVRTRLGWGERPIVLTVGRLQKRKGHDVLIQALRQVRKAVPGVLYAIAGDGEERSFLQDLVAREGLQEHVRFLGELEDEQLVRCYQQCDLFALPNRQLGQDIEGFGMVLLEAQACGKPVVAGASGGTAETMRIPETGQVVPCDGPDQLAALLIELLSDGGRRACMGTAAREWVVERFDWAALSRQAEQLFEQASARRRPAAEVTVVHS
jgi:phosphatidylinositol alpha-1,6-mannosyltransferase